MLLKQLLYVTFKFKTQFCSWCLAVFTSLNQCLMKCYLTMSQVSCFHNNPDSLISFSNAGAAWRRWVAPGLTWLCSFDRSSRRRTNRQTASFLSGCLACCCSCLSVSCYCNWLSTSAGNSDRVGMLLTFHVQPMSRPLAMLYLLWCCVAKWIL